VPQGVRSGGLEAIAAVGLLFLLNPVLLSATAKAARRSEEAED
jgi:multisubunit Na+/H+ antiporter MnhG subunit